MTARQFPIHPDDRKLLASVPWDLVAQHEAQVKRNYRQDLEALAARQGLDLLELHFVLCNRQYQFYSRSKAQRAKAKEDALAYIKRRIEWHEAKPVVPPLNLVRGRIEIVGAFTHDLTLNADLEVVSETKTRIL